MTQTINEINKEKRDILRAKVKEILFNDITTANIKLHELDLVAELSSVGDTIIKNADNEIVAIIELEHNLD
jgi:hypothetical protein